MIKNFLNVFKIHKSKLTMEELKACSKIVNNAVKVFIISIITIIICIIFSSKNIAIGIIGIVAFMAFCISLSVCVFGDDIDLIILKLEKAKNIMNLIKEGQFDKIYCVDKDINKMLFDISLEKGNAEITVKKDKIIVTVDGMEIPLEIDNVNDYFGMY